MRRIVKKIQDALERKTIVITLSILLTSLLIIFVIGLLPIFHVEYFLRQGFINPNQIPTLENSYRKTYAQIIGGIVLLVGLWFTYRRILAAEINAETAQKGEITERLTRSIEQLNDQKLSTKIGGIYGLKRIAVEDKESKESIVEILCSYLEENSTEINDDFITQEKYNRQTISPHDIIKSTETLIDLSERGIGTDFRSVNLVGFSFDQKKLNTVAFNDTNCVELSFFHFEWENIHFNYSVFSRCLFDDSSFRLIHFKFAECIHSTFYNNEFEMVNMSLSSYLNTSFNLNEFSNTCAFSGSDFKGAELRSNNFRDTDFMKSEFYGNAKIIHNDFTDCSFEKCGFENTFMNDNKFVNCTFEDCYLNESQILNNEFQNCLFDGARIEQSNKFSNNEFAKTDLDSIIIDKEMEKKLAQNNEFI